MSLGARFLSVIGAAGCVIGWVGMMVGPRSLMLFGFAGFVAALPAGMFARRSPVAAVEGSSRFQRGLRTSIRALFGVFFVGLVLMFATGRLDGVGEFPALQRRTTYELNNHGERTRVSRARFVSEGVAFATGWTAMALVANLSALYRALYGKDGD
ncbi:MAG TPA: hypothetical protein VFK70_08085 [Vicinamibacteria bacterium]|nr:hypothetical protein [Vicinamibacteria bacterium]